MNRSGGVFVEVVPLRDELIGREKDGAAKILGITLNDLVLLIGHDMRLRIRRDFPSGQKVIFQQDVAELLGLNPAIFVRIRRIRFIDDDEMRVGGNVTVNELTQSTT